MRNLMLAVLLAAPVVVELFTSQGCSSCPPADALLAELQRDPSVIALAYHVDYWNSLGWRDPFSSPKWSERQRQYVQAMKLSTAYTPQAVLNGERQVIGSNRGVMRSEIKSLSERTPDAILAASLSDGYVTLRTGASDPSVHAFVVTVENAQPTQVARGENAGRALVNPAVVHDLIDAGPVQRQMKVAVKPEGRAVVVLLQNVTTRKIVGAARATSAAAAPPATR